MKRTLILVITGLALFALSAVAQAHTRLVLPDGSTPQPEQRWIDSARVPTPDVNVPYQRRTCPPDPGDPFVWDACTIGGFDGKIDAMYISPTHSGGIIRARVLHEEGQVVDFNTTDAVRLKFRAIMHDARHVEWINYSQTTEPPAERFADAFQTCAQWPTWERMRHALPSWDVWRSKTGLRFADSDWGWYPTRFQYDKVCMLLGSL